MEAFGWHAIVVDGHDIEEICKAFHDAATTKGKPTCFIAKTFKGNDLNAFSPQDYDVIGGWRAAVVSYQTPSLVRGYCSQQLQVGKAAHTASEQCSHSIQQ